MRFGVANVLGQWISAPSRWMPTYAGRPGAKRCSNCGSNPRRRYQASDAEASATRKIGAMSVGMT